MSGTSLKWWSTFYKREIAYSHLKLKLSSAQCICLVWVSTFQSIAKVILRRSVHLTTLVPGQAWLSKSPVLSHVLSLVTDNNQNDRRDYLIINFHISMGPAARLTTDCAMGPYDWIRAGPEVIKLFSCSTQLSTNFILLINVETPIFFGILTSNY